MESAGRGCADAIARAHAPIDDHRVLILCGKGAKERTVKIPPELLERIRAAYRGDRYLFETQHGRRYDRSQVSNDIKRLGRRILGRRISAHTFRHTFATRMIEKTGKTEAVSRYLGHASPSITLAMYVHQSLDSAELFG
jgi:integrase